jgi:glycosyltransferase involved in cell wall biosynthesis
MKRIGVSRLACYGWVGEHAGSTASANYVLLEELLRRGLQLDLYAHREHIPEPVGLRGPGFVYRGFPQPRWLDLVDRLPGGGADASRALLFPLIARAWQGVMQPTANSIHRQAPYDAVLALGTDPVFALENAPTITWLQGPYHTELEALRRLKHQVVAAAGRPYYAAITAWYRYRGMALRIHPVRSDRVIVGSDWARRAVLEREGSDPPIDALPYPVDLETFRPEPAYAPDPEAPLVLSLGRLDPRKRLDLLLESFDLVRETIPGARLLIVGSAGRIPGALAPLHRSAQRDAVEYRPPIPRQQVPSLLREAAVLVQASENENFGSSVAEALACGTPVVVGPSNGTASYIDGCSRVFDAYTSEALADAVVEVLRIRREQPDEVRASTRASAERWFSAPRIVDWLLEIVSAAIAERAA